MAGWTSIDRKKIAWDGDIYADKFFGDGSGLTGVGATPAGNNKNIQYNDNGTLAGSDNFTWDEPGTLFNLNGYQSFWDAEFFAITIISQEVTATDESNGYIDIAYSDSLQSNTPSIVGSVYRDAGEILYTSIAETPITYDGNTIRFTWSGLLEDDVVKLLIFYQ